MDDGLTVSGRVLITGPRELHVSDLTIHDITMDLTCDTVPRNAELVIQSVSI